MDIARLLGAVAIATVVNATCVPAQADPTATPSHAFTVNTGALAPDFGFRAHDGSWRTLGDLLTQGDVLLVLGADDDCLAHIERERGALLDAGIVPIAVMESPSQDVWRSVYRLGVGYSVLSDPALQLARDFGALGVSSSLPAARAWFVIDRHGRVRAEGSGEAPRAGWASFAAYALERPLAGAIFTADAD